MHRDLQIVALCGLLAGVSCSDPVDESARRRVFSPEDPPSDVVRAADRIDVAAASRDPARWERLWTMSAGETNRRAGAYKLRSRLAWTWKQGERAVHLTEDVSFETDARGQFHGVLSTDRDTGLEFVWVDGQAFARGRFGPYRSRRLDRAEHGRWRDEFTGVPRLVWDLLGRRLRPGEARTDKGSIEVELGLGEAAPGGVMPAPAALVYGRHRPWGADDLLDGPDPGTRRRLLFWQGREPVSVAGDTRFDSRTGVLIELRSQLRFRVPSEAGDDSSLDLDVTYTLTPQTQLQIQAPEAAEAPPLRHVTNDPLWFLRDKATGPRRAGETAEATPIRSTDDDDRE